MGKKKGTYSSASETRNMEALSSGYSKNILLYWLRVRFYSSIDRMIEQCEAGGGWAGLSYGLKGQTNECTWMRAWALLTITNNELEPRTRGSQNQRGNPYKHPIGPKLIAYTTSTNCNFFHCQ